MSNIEMACTQAQWDCCLAKLRQALQNKSAQERYTTMMSVKYTHPGWVDPRNKSTFRRTSK